MDPTIRAFKEMAGVKALTLKRSADGNSVELAEPLVEVGDVVDFSFPFIWWANPDLIYWNASELIILATGGPISFRVYGYDSERQAYKTWRAY